MNNTGTGKVWRFIPTNVGNTIHEASAAFSYSVHPHERGEYSLSVIGCHITSGSSPRTWGIHQSGRNGASSRRFIPTNVGNTAMAMALAMAMAVHPHERGEYSFQDGVIFISLRFIPTNVGNTPTSRLLRRKVPVHPHERGEYVCQKVQNNILGGSSPRTWGIL